MKQQSTSVIRDGFRLVQERFAMPQDNSGFDRKQMHAFKICNLFLNEKLHVGDIVRLLNDDRARVVHALLEQGVIEERRKKLRKLPSQKERRQWFTSLN